MPEPWHHGKRRRRDLASVKLHSTQLVDYMHLVGWEGEWKILEVPWDIRPADRPRPPGVPPR